MSPPTSPPSSGARRAAGVGALVVAALSVVALTLGPGILAALVAGAVTGALAPPAFADPGAGVRWGHLVARVVADLSGSLAVGLLLAAFVLPSPAGRPQRMAGRASPAALGFACAAGVVWALASTTRLVLGYAAGTGQGLGEPSLGTQLVSYVTQVGAGRWAAAGVAGAVAVASLAAVVTGRRAAAVLVLLALATFGAQTLADAAGTPGRSAASTLVLWLHAVAAAVVVGGAGALLLLSGALPRGLPPVARRLVRAGAWVLVLLGVSGVVAQPPPAGRSAGALWSLLAGKAVALVALALLLWRGGRRSPADTAAGSLVLGAALAVGAAAVGIGAALAIVP